MKFFGFKRITALTLLCVLLLAAVQLKSFAGSGDVFVSIYAEGDMSYGIKSDKTAWKWGGGIVTPVCFAENVKQILRGLMLKNDGTLYSIWNGDMVAGVSDADKITENGWALDENGAICYMRHDYDTYGSIPELTGMTGIKEITKSYILKNDGTLWLYNRNDKVFSNGEAYPKLMSDLTDVLDIKHGSDAWEFTAVLKKDGTVWKWTKDDWGSETPQFVSSQETVPARIENIDNVLSIDITFNIKTVYRTSGMMFPILERGIIAVKSDGTVWKSGYPDSDIKKIEGIEDAVSVKAGSHHFVILNKKGEVFTFGENTGGQLGNGTSASINYPRKIARIDGAVKVGADIGHTAVLTENGTVFEWYNTDADTLTYLDQSNMRSFAVPDLDKMTGFSVMPEYTKVSYSGSCYEVRRSGESVWSEVAADDAVATAQNQSWIPGTSYPRKIAELRRDGTVYIIHGTGEYVFIENLQDAASIGMTYSKLYALKKDGTVWGEVDYRNKEFSRVEGLWDISAISCGYKYSLALKRDGTVYQINDKNEAVRVELLSNIISVAAGGVTYREKKDGAGEKYNYFAALQSDGSIWVWGDNSNGHLGISGKTTEAAEKIVQSRAIYSINDTAMVFEGMEYAVDPGRNTVPVIINDRTFIPVRSLIEKLGGAIEWDEVEKKIGILCEGNRIEMWVDNKAYKVNGETKEFDVPPQIVNDRTMMPIRFVTEELGLSVYWNDDLKKVYIN